jgi:hypothetical protein
MTLALCICKASKPEDIVIYFKGLVTKQMCKDNVKQYSTESAVSGELTEGKNGLFASQDIAH